MATSCYKAAAVLLFAALLKRGGFILSVEAQQGNRIFVSVNAHLVDTRLDPVVNEGTCSGHVHSVMGSAAFKSIVTMSDLVDPDWQNDVGKELQTTSNIIPNLSQYWAPSLYIYNPASDEYYLVPTFSRAYYRISYRDSRTEVNPFPMGLRMLVGNAARKDNWTDESIPWDDDFWVDDPDQTGHDKVKWTNRTDDRSRRNHMRDGDWRWLKESRTATEIGHMSQLEMNIDFPECVAVDANNVPILDSANHRDHLSYDAAERGRLRFTCPSTHPYRIPRLNLEVRYKINEMRPILGSDVVNNVANWIMSTNDTTGASAHSDFISGWPEPIMADSIMHCGDGWTLPTSPPGSCPLEPYQGASRAEMESKEVPFTNPIPDENVHVVDKLPTGACPPFVPATDLSTPSAVPSFAPTNIASAIPSFFPISVVSIRFKDSTNSNVHTLQDGDVIYTSILGVSTVRVRVNVDGQVDCVSFYYDEAFLVEDCVRRKQYDDGIDLTVGAHNLTFVLLSPGGQEVAETFLFDVAN